MRRPIFRLCILTLALAPFAAEGATTESRSTGVLPLWVDAGQAASVWLETRFPGDEEFPLRVPATARYLIVKLDAAEIVDPPRQAFELKNLVVEARGGAPEL